MRRRPAWSPTRVEMPNVSPPGSYSPSPEGASVSETRNPGRASARRSRRSAGEAVQLGQAVLAGRHAAHLHPARRPEARVDDRARGLPRTLAVDQEEDLRLAADDAGHLGRRGCRVGPVASVVLDQCNRPCCALRHRRGSYLPGLRLRPDGTARGSPHAVRRRQLEDAQAPVGGAGVRRGARRAHRRAGRGRPRGGADVPLPVGGGRRAGAARRRRPRPERARRTDRRLHRRGQHDDARRRRCDRRAARALRAPPVLRRGRRGAGRQGAGGARGRARADPLRRRDRRPSARRARPSAASPCRSPARLPTSAPSSCPDSPSHTSRCGRSAPA